MAHLSDIKTPDLPYPVSRILNKYNRIDKNSLSERETVLVGIFEALVKFLVIVMICETPKEVPRTLSKNYEPPHFRMDGAP